MLRVILSYLPYALITTFTPGPNNLMALYSVSHGGWRTGSRVILGIASGFVSLMVIVIAFCHELAEYAPELVKYLKYVGAAYILWLAVHIALSRPSESEGQMMTFGKGFALSLSNVKVILYLITIFTAYVIPSGAGFAQMCLHGVFIIALSTVSWALWGGVGGILQAFLAEYWRPFNIAMGIALLWCAWQIVM
ncbi:MAG: LysE family transporter [Synergistaceae bacterium]|nr:LysE family transporter [Synergistaceae bacterium]